MHLLAQGKKGLSNVELGRRLGVSTNAAWRVQHKLMQAMIERDRRYQLGTAGPRIEIDDAYIGGERTGEGAGPAGAAIRPHMGIGRVNWLFGHADSFLGSDLGSSRLFSCSSTVPQNLTSGRRSERLTPKSLVLEVTGLEDGANLYRAILQPGRYAAHPPRSDEEFSSVDTVMVVSDCSPRYAAFSTAPSGTSPWVT